MVCVHECVLVCVRQKEQGCASAFVSTFTHFVYEHVHLCMFTYTVCPDVAQGHCQIKVHSLPDYQGRTTAHQLHSIEKQTSLSETACSCTETGLCFTSKKVKSLEAQGRSTLAQCLVSYRIRHVMFG